MRISNETIRRAVDYAQRTGRMQVTQSKYTERGMHHVNLQYVDPDGRILLEAVTLSGPSR